MSSKYIRNTENRITFQIRYRLCAHFIKKLKTVLLRSNKKLVLRYVNIFMNHYVDKNMLKLQCHLYEFAARRNKCKIL